MPNQDPSIAQELLSHQTFLKRLAIDLVGEDADDLVQEVWQRALERPPHHGRQLRGWLARIARNVAANRWRGEARRTDREERRASEQPAAEELEARFELRKELVGALDSLSPSCRETILLRYFEGLAPRDIASRQGTPVATVKTRLRRGLAQLREALDKRYGGDRRAWMSAVTALGAPVGSGVAPGTLVIGGMAMGTMMKMSAAVLLAAACVYFVARTPPAESPRMAAVEPPAADVELVGAELVSPADDPATEAVRRTVMDELRVGVSLARATNVLRVVLEGITEDDARMATVTLTGVDERDEWPAEIRDSWPCQGLTNEFDLDPFFASVAERHENLRVEELEVEVAHPVHLDERTRVPLSRGVELANGQTVYEVRVRPVRPVYGPGVTLAVRDARTRAHLEHVELYSVGGTYMGMPRVPEEDGFFISLGGGMSSPIVLLGGHEPGDPENLVAGLALGPAAGESPRLVEPPQRVRPEHGFNVYARAPGYAWGSTTLDVTTEHERELLLGPAAALNVRIANVQLERYAALEVTAFLVVNWFRADGGVSYVRRQRLDETLETEGLRLEGVEPGEYAVSVELRGGLWKKRPVLAREEVSLAAGDMREVVLALKGPPAPPERATLGGMVAFPAPTVTWGEERVRLQLYHDTSGFHEPHVELSLVDLERVGGALPTWSFHLEDLPVGLYRAQLLPFMKSWMIELPAGGREGVELVVPELAEVLVETVDARTGERVPLEEFYFIYEEVLPGQKRSDWARADLEEPGRFRIWTAPGATYIYTLKIPSGLNYATRSMDLELVPGFQSVHFELEPVYAFRIELRNGGLPRFDAIWGEVRNIENLRAIDHEGHATKFSELELPNERLVEVSAPGLYEVSFDGVATDRFHPIPPQRVYVRAGDTAEVIVELRRK
jgi:RNA polymerase sigma-70 factor (ECF subfamily)